MAAPALLVALLAAACALAPPSARAADPYVLHPDLDYDLGTPVTPAAHNRLDLYVPRATARRPRAVVVYVHGGGWARGDKRAVGEKARLFTRAGYVFASVNYRLSPDGAGVLAPDRVRFPDHPHDVGEALGWLRRNVGGFGGDPDRLVLTGHSAGAHLVSLLGTDPSWSGAYGSPARAVRGIVSLDTAAFDVAARTDPARSRRPALFWNAFGTPEEEAADARWASASPITHADPGDPPFLLVTQQRPLRVAENAAMLRALGDRPIDALLAVPLDHAGINRALGSPGDTTGETEAVLAFVARVAGRPPRTRITRAPARMVRTARRRARVRFAFRATGPADGFRCRVDGGPYRRCTSPQRLRVTPGRHVFRVRAVLAGRPGAGAKRRFRVVAR